MMFSSFFGEGGHFQTEGNKGKSDAGPVSQPSTGTLPAVNSVTPARSAASKSNVSAMEGRRLTVAHLWPRRCV